MCWWVRSRMESLAIRRPISSDELMVDVEVRVGYGREWVEWVEWMMNDEE